MIGPQPISPWQGERRSPRRAGPRPQSSAQRGNALSDFDSIVCVSFDGSTASLAKGHRHRRLGQRPRKELATPCRLAESHTHRPRVNMAFSQRGAVPCRPGALPASPALPQATVTMAFSQKIPQGVACKGETTKWAQPAKSRSREESWPGEAREDTKRENVTEPYLFFRVFLCFSWPDAAPLCRPVRACLIRAR